MLKLFVFLFFIFNYYNTFEISIVNESAEPVPPSMQMNSFDVAKDLFEGLAEELQREENNDEDRHRRRKHRRVSPRMKSPRHKEIIETSGPGFTTVEVREYMSNDDNDNVKKNNDPFSKDGFDDLFSAMQNPIPVVFVKTTTSRKNLQQRRDNELQNPFKIFSQMDNIFDSFFKINKLPSLPLPNDDRIKVINLTDIINKIDNDLKEEIKITNPELENKLIKIIPAEDNKKEENRAPVITKEKEKEKEIPKKEAEPQKLKEVILTSNFEELSPLYKLVKYSSYVLLFIILVCFAKCIFSKVSEQEKSSLKPNLNTKHSINEIEDELKQMKDRNKLY